MITLKDLFVNSLKKILLRRAETKVYLGKRMKPFHAVAVEGLQKRVEKRTVLRYHILVKRLYRYEIHTLRRLPKREIQPE